MTAPTGTTAYHERLRVPWTWWLPAVLIAAALAAPFAWGLPAAVRPAAAVLPLATLGALWWLGRIRVTVVSDEFQVDDARLPLRYISEAVPLGRAGRQQLLGPAADPLAFVIQRPWVPGAVQVLLDDPADPTPYWLISTNRPEQLAAALTGPAPGGGHTERAG